jgi:hypothetical protein
MTSPRNGAETLLGTFSDAEVLEIGDSEFASTLRVLTEEGEAVACLDGKTVLLRRATLN